MHIIGDNLIIIPFFLFFCCTCIIDILIVPINAINFVKIYILSTFIYDLNVISI